MLAWPLLLLVPSYSTAYWCGNVKKCRIKVTTGEDPAAEFQDQTATEASCQHLLSPKQAQQTLVDGAATSNKSSQCNQKIDTWDWLDNRLLVLWLTIGNAHMLASQTAVLMSH